MTKTAYQFDNRLERIKARDPVAYHISERESEIGGAEKSGTMQLKE